MRILEDHPIPYFQPHGAELRTLAELAVQLVAEARRRPGAPGDPFVHVGLLQQTVLSDVLPGDPGRIDG